MARSKSWNPLAFLPTQVTVIASAVYVALIAVLVVVHVSVPAAPANPTPASGINLTQAWRDLEFLSDGYHPVGSRRNDAVRQYLLRRVGDILESNAVQRQNVYASGGGWISDTAGPSLVTVFANDSSNFTSADDWTQRPVTLYGESDNIIVYIRGQDDTGGDWWNASSRYNGPGGVLVNAHYDSVSSGLGATDDGVGVVSILQLISHYTTKGNQPRRGLVALLNNGEENGLYGARSYVRHPISQLPHTFLNLEGAGAGGRANLFRSTDAEVTKAYCKSPYPFGTVVSGDGFKRGFVRSGTDYSVFTEELGLRGLDVAFYEPRASYHTDRDDSRNTNRDSVWHMLSAALATTRELTSYKGTGFDGSPRDDGKLDTGVGSDAVYFDLLGRAFAVAKLNTLFALSVTLLVAGPIIFILLEIIIRKNNKWYPFAGKKYLHSSDDDEAVRIHGRRGFSRFLIAFVISTGVVVSLAYLLTKLNPNIIYSSEYAVWALFISAWFAVAWFFLAGAAEIRPTALHRMFCVVWLYVISWILLVFTTVGEHQLHIASGYFFVIYNATVCVALLISYLELFALPNIHSYVEKAIGAHADSASTRPGSRSSRQILDNAGGDEAEPSERSSLLQHSNTRADQHTFTRFRRRADRDDVPEDSDDPYLNQPYMDEQAWSSSLPQWTWIIQFLILAPINIIIVGQIALMLTASINQTLADGNPALPIYLILAALTVILLLPLTPYLHRFTFHVPTFLFLVFVGCLIYSLVAFPFSRDARMKYYFVQHVNLDSGANNVTVLGLDGFVQTIIAEMPSAAGQDLNCGGTSVVNRDGLIGCHWNGLLPNVVPRDYPSLSKNSTNKGKYAHRDWLDLKVKWDGKSALFSLRGLNSKLCRISFDNAVSRVHIGDSAIDARQRPVGQNGSNEIRLMSRTWDKTFQVNVTWDNAPAKGQKGKAWCLWSDANERGTIPAFDELKRFEPVWAAVTKTSDGLMEGFKEFEV